MDGTDVSEQVETTPRVEAEPQVEETPHIEVDAQVEETAQADAEPPVETEAEAAVDIPPAVETEPEAVVDAAPAVDTPPAAETSETSAETETETETEPAAVADAPPTAEIAEPAVQSETVEAVGAEETSETPVASVEPETEPEPEPISEPVSVSEAAPVAESAPEPAPEPATELATESGPEVEVDGASLMEQYLSDPSHDYKTLKYGDVIDGTIMRIDRDELLVDIGSKSEGIVPAREFSSLANEEKQALSIGETVLVFVIQAENPEGHPVVSIDRARQEKSWRRLQEIYEANEVIEAEVTNYNKGGLLVNLDGVRGFVPASQVSEIRGGDEASKQADMARLIGSSLPLKVIEINRHRNRLILSERQAIQERRDEMKEKLIGELKEGEVRHGRVSSICDFGAFVDIGGADGLVHLSELSWSRVRHPSEVLRVGQEIDVYVLGINPQEKKIALSIKRTQAEPWSRVASKYEVGQLVKGTVTQLANFGAFARIEDGIEGLIHVSELADERITHPKQVVHEGQDLILRIIRIDPQRRRMGLSLRRALDTPDAELEAVFGPEILAERDALVQDIRASLEAEGIEPVAPGERDADDEAAAASTSTPTAPVEAEPPAVEGEGTGATDAAEPVAAEAATDTATDTVAEAPAAVEETGTESEAAPAAEPKTPRTRASRRKSDALPEEIDGEPLSAMAMAFAMAAPELVHGNDDDEQSTNGTADAAAGDGGEEQGR